VPDYIDRARSALRNLFAGGPPKAVHTAPASVTRLDDDLTEADGKITFADPERAARNPAAWLQLLEGGLEHNLPFANGALELLRAQASHLSASEMLWGMEQSRRFIDLLSPRAGLAARLSDLHASGVLAALFPEFYGKSAGTHSLTAIDRLERFIGETDLTGSRFGTMLRELTAPELVVLALLLHYPGTSKDHEPAKAADLALPVLDRLLLEGDSRHAVDFLIEQQLQMAHFAFRQDTSDPGVIAKFAAGLKAAAELNSMSAEEHLKMLCVLTASDGGGGTTPLTSWRAELLWRLFVDTYNHLTTAYGDEVIDRDVARRTALHGNRPQDIGEQELVQFLEGFPQRYLTLFDADTIYQHVRLGRQIGPTDVHTFLARRAEALELTVVTLDKPYLFSDISGVLSYLGADILRGQALTNRNGLVIDVFEFVHRTREIGQDELNQLLSNAITGKIDIAARLAEQHRSNDVRPALPLLRFDNDSSQRYTVLELVADDMPGLLHRTSRALSDFGCEVDLVLISTEGDKAFDVFHMRKSGAKLAETDQLALTEHLERAIRNRA